MKYTAAILAAATATSAFTVHLDNFIATCNSSECTYRFPVQEITGKYHECVATIKTAEKRLPSVQTLVNCPLVPETGPSKATGSFDIFFQTERKDEGLNVIVYWSNDGVTSSLIDSHLFPVSEIKTDALGEHLVSEELIVLSSHN